MLYQATIEDPGVLVEPWLMAPRTMRLNKAPDAGLIPGRAYCEVFDIDPDSSLEGSHEGLRSSTGATSLVA